MRAAALIALLMIACASARAEDDSEGGGEGAPPPAHPTMRVGVDYGRGDDGGNIFSIEYRLMQHDLAEPFAHHATTSLGEILKIRAGYLTRGSRFRVEELTLLRTLTVPPINVGPERELAYKLRIGFETVRDASCVHCFAGVIEGGIGAAVQPFPKAPFEFFVTADAEVGLAPGFDNFVKVGLGPAGGIRWHPTDELALIAQAKYRYQLLTSAHNAHAVGAEARWRCWKTLALRLKGDHYPDGWEGNAGILYYF